MLLKFWHVKESSGGLVKTDYWAFPTKPLIPRSVVKPENVYRDADASPHSENHY